MAIWERATDLTAAELEALDQVTGTVLSQRRAADKSSQRSPRSGGCLSSSTQAGRW